MVRLTKQQLLILGGVVMVIIVLLYFAFFSGGSKSKEPAGAITVWGTDDQAMFGSIIGAYAQLRLTVTVTYKQLDPATYDATILNALAAGRGPDVFMIGNRSLPRELDKLLPADVAQMSIARLEQLFPTVVEQDFSLGGRVYALPFSIDTLALLYNRDQFDQAALTAPPATWDDLVRVVPKLRVVGADGTLARAAAAIGGTTKSMTAATDLLELLMLQNGVKMTDDTLTTATFATQGSDAGVGAFRFYLQFADPSSPSYTWNDSRPEALDALSGGRVTMVFGYHEDLATLKQKNPFLAVRVAPVPQPAGGSGAVSWAAYRGFAVSRQSRASAAAWDFVTTVTTNPGIAKAYADATKRPPALRALIAGAADDPDLGVFATQALTARSWYEADDGKIESIMNDAIALVLAGGADAPTALRRAESRVTQLMKPAG